MENIKLRKKYKCIDFRLAIACLCMLFLTSKYYIEIVMKEIPTPMPKLLLVLGVFCAGILLLIKLKNKNIKRIEIVLGIFFVMQFVLTDNTLFLIGYIFALALGMVDFRRLMKFYFVINLAYFLSVILLSDKGLIPIEFVGIRSDLGFKNPNTAFISFFMIWSAYLYLYLSSENSILCEFKEKSNCTNFNPLKNIELFVLVSFPILVYSQTKTRTGLLTIGIVFILLIIITLFRQNNLSLKILEYIPQVLAIMSLVIAYVCHNKSLFNRLLSDRPKYWAKYLMHWDKGLNFWGYDTNIRDTVFADRLPLDSGYIYAIYVGGLILFIILIKIMSISIRQLVRENKIAEVVFMSSILIYGFAETTILDIATNPTLILVYIFFIKYWQEMKRNKGIN